MGVHLHARTIDSLMEAGEVRVISFSTRVRILDFFIVLLYAVNVAENEKWLMW